MKKTIIRIVSKFMMKLGGDLFKKSYTMHKLADFVVKKTMDSDDIFEIQGFKMKKGRTTRLLILTGEHEPATTDLINKQVKHGMSVFDLGANIGWFTLILSRLVGNSGHVYSFEPDPNLFKILKENIELNKLNNVSVFQLAISNHTGFGKFSLNEIQDGDNRLESNSMSMNSIDVEITTLDEFCKKHNANVDFIKMDIQGSEPRVLDGMKNVVLENPKLMMVTEFYQPALIDVGNSPKHFLDDLEKNGFLINEITGIKTCKLKSIRKDELLLRFDDVNLFCYKS